MSEYPLDWTRTTFGNILNQRKEAGFTNEELLAVTSSLGIVKRDTLERRDTSNEDKSKYLLVNEGDIAYNTMRMWQGVSGVSRFRGIVSPAYTICTPTERLDANFAGYMLKDPQMVSVFRQRSQGLVSDTWNLKYESFAQIPCAIPPLPEQKKIAEILSGIDKMISAKSIRHEKRKTTAHLILDSVLSNAELRQAPLSDIALLERGKFSHRPRNDPDYYGGEFPFIQTGDIPKTGIRISEHKQTLNRKGLEVSRQFPSGTVVITIAATIGEVGILSYPACFPDSLVGITPNTEECDPVFLLYSLRRLKDKLLQMAPQSAQSNLNLEILGKLDVPLPPLYEQRKFAQMICYEDERATAEVIGIRKLHDMKAAVASDLLSGRKRVSI